MKRLIATITALIVLALYALLVDNSWGWCATFIVAAAIIVGVAKFRTYVTPAQLEAAFEQAKQVTDQEDDDTQPMDLRALWPSGIGSIE